MSTLDRIPPPLRCYVIEQRYDDYTEADQRVWRTVVGRLHAALRSTAHPAYHEGLPRTGMSAEAIPRIEAMDRALAEVGWGTVGVDGFVPPRVFQALQAERILPIACAIRSPDHLDYTPAPDIVHEAAGHAPILIDPAYATFLERIGAVGARAFSGPSDREAFDAIRALSIAKEQSTLDAGALAVAEARVHAAMETTAAPSEATRLARLYWWTVEYGLVGTLDTYRLYGAGLLSSLGESTSCHDASVRKLPLDVSCTDVGYDITRPQPQLFVAESFAHLHAVLAGVEARLACTRGGLEGLRVAADSREEAVLRFASGTVVTGRVTDVRPIDGGYRVGLAGPVRLTKEGTTVALDGFVSLVGPPDALVLEADTGARELPPLAGPVVSCAPSTLAAAWST